MVEIMDSSVKGNDVLGYTTIPVSDLADQYKHEDWYFLNDRNGNQTNAKIFLIVQWIHSKVRSS